MEINLAYNNIATSDDRSSKARDYTCYHCGLPIYFTSKDSETPSGMPTKDPITGKAKPLDPSTKEYHVCKQEDIESFRQTDEYKQRLSDWKSKQQQDDRNGVGLSSSKEIGITQINEGVTHVKSLPMLEQILVRLTDMKDDLTIIKATLKIDGASLDVSEG
jgi:hypothetical protein